MIILILGAPGAGKGTLADKLAARLRIPKISTGDIFRQQIARHTPLGEAASRYIEKGQLAPDEVTIGIVAARIKEDDCRDGLILDGFPRTIPQAVALNNLLTSAGRRVDLVVNIQTSDEVILKRLGGRRVCNACGAIYHVTHTPPARNGVCDRCGQPLSIRRDDREETIRERLETYRRQTEPLITYYAESGLIRSVDGEQSPEQVAEAVRSVLETADQAS